MFVIHRPTELIFWKRHIPGEELEMYINWFEHNYSKPKLFKYVNPSIKEKIEFAEKFASQCSAFLYKHDPFFDLWSCYFKDKDIAAHFGLVWGVI